LFLSVAAGYVRAGRDRIEKHPDQRVQEALSLVFAKFTELQSVRQVHVWLRDEGIALPVACHRTAEGRSIAWRLPLYNTVHNILTNPVYAGSRYTHRIASGFPRARSAPPKVLFVCSSARHGAIGGGGIDRGVR